MNLRDNRELFFITWPHFIQSKKHGLALCTITFHAISITPTQKKTSLYDTMILF